MSGNKALQKITVYLSSETVSKLDFLVELKRAEVNHLFEENPEIALEQISQVNLSATIRRIIDQWIKEHRDLFILSEMVRRKGEGAEYGPEITRLSDMHRKILRILAREEHLTKQQITNIINEEKRENEPYTGGFSISGRLSELCGAGLIKMEYREVELYDQRSMQFRFVKKPVWFLTDEGIKESKIHNLREFV